MAFHEKAGPRQVDFDLSFLKFSLSFLTGGCSERPGAVKGAFFAAERTLDGEDRSVTIPSGRKGSGRSRFLVLLAFFLRAQTNPVATLPSALSMSDFCFARCKLGVLVSAGAAT
jgi:hypothetical protein